MSRQSISFTVPTKAWMKQEVESDEYTTRGEVVNDLICKAGETGYSREKFVQFKQGSFSKLAADEMLAAATQGKDAELVATVTRAL